MSLSKPKQETPLVEPFQMAEILSTVERQATETEKLRAEKERLLTERERFLKLAESELKLKQENDNLRSLLAEEQKNRKRAEQRAEALERELHTQAQAMTSQLSAEVDKLTKRLPSTESVTGLAQTLKKAEESASTLNAFQFINWIVIAVFLVVVGFVGYNSYYGRTSAEHTENMVNWGVYDRNGVSVLDGSQSKQSYQERQQQKQNSR